MVTLDATEGRLELDDVDQAWSTLWFVDTTGGIRLGSDAAPNVRSKLLSGCRHALRAAAEGGSDGGAQSIHVLSLFESHHSVYLSPLAGGVLLTVQDRDAIPVRTVRLTLAEVETWVDLLSVG